MSLELILFGIILTTMFIVMVLYVLFGQLTVRKLRKNPETKHELGIEFASGLDILNVAQALTVPRATMQKYKNKQTFLSAFYADADLLYKHTNRFDRVLARVLYVLFVLCGSGGIALVIIDALGFFE